MPSAAAMPLGSQPADELEAVRHRAAQLASQLRLPFRTRVWRGRPGMEFLIAVSMTVSPFLASIGRSVPSWST